MPISRIFLVLSSLSDNYDEALRRNDVKAIVIIGKWLQKFITSSLSFRIQYMKGLQC